LVFVPHWQCDPWLQPWFCCFGSLFQPQVKIKTFTFNSYAIKINWNWEFLVACCDKLMNYSPQWKLLFEKSLKFITLTHGFLWLLFNIFSFRTSLSPKKTCMNEHHLVVWNLVHHVYQ
jgi:hypothetical protein